MRNDEIDTDSGKDDDITTPPTKGVFQSVKMKKLMRFLGSRLIKMRQSELMRLTQAMQT